MFCAFRVLIGLKTCTCTVNNLFMFVKYQIIVINVIQLVSKSPTVHHLLWSNDPINNHRERIIFKLREKFFVVYFLPKKIGVLRIPKKYQIAKREHFLLIFSYSHFYLIHMLHPYREI